MIRLLLLPAIMVLLLVSVSVAQAQTATVPTVSTVAVTSNPGTDNTYATGDKIEVTVTFSEAVTVTTTGGTPRLSIDIGGQPRNIPYDRAGTSTGQLIFGYTVFAGDMDADGIAVKADGLALNGGTIRSTDDSTDADLDISAQTFATHKVDTEVTLVSNIGQADATETITISATESAEATFRIPETDNGFDLTGIVLDLKTASATLDVTINVNLVGPAGLDAAHDFTFTGSAASAGNQVFSLGDLFHTRANVPLAGLRSESASFSFRISISGSGEGSIEIGATTSSAEDTSGQSGFSIGNPASGATVPRFGLVGHTAAVRYIYHAEVMSKPADGASYKAGEHIAVLFLVSRAASPANAPPMAGIWLGNGAEHYRAAQRVGSHEFGGFQTLVYSYEVQAGDADADGILLAENTLGRNENFDFVDYLSNVPVDLSMPAVQQGTGQSVQGSQAQTCQDIWCATLVVVEHGIPGVFAPIYENGEYVDAVGVTFPVAYDLTSSPASHKPLEYYGSLSQPTFTYGETSYAISLIQDWDGESVERTTPDGPIHVLLIALQPEIPHELADRLAFAAGNNMIPVGEAEINEADPFTVYTWRDPGLEWEDGDVLQVKLIELPVTATFDAAAYGSDEGGSVDVTVTLGDYFEKTVTLPLTVTGVGGATAADYSGVPSELVFAPGETEKTFTVELTDDDVDDDDESVTLSFGAAPSAVKSGGDHETATVAIRDDDDPEVDVEFGAATYSADEGSTATVAVTLSADPERTVTIPLIKTEQGGVSNADYSGVPASVTFNTGETSKTFTFTAAQDDVDDDHESVKLTFGTLPDRVSEGTQDETTVSIVDDDDPHVDVQFGAATYSAVEGGTVGVTVTLSADPERTVIVPLIKAEQGGVSSADYFGVPASVTFNTGQTSKTFTFTVPQDDVDDDDESVKLTFGALPTRVSEGTQDETTVRIVDDDNPHVTVQFTQDEYTVVEGSNVAVRLRLSADPERTVSIPITITNQGGATAADYTVPSSVTFDAGDTEKTFTFAATDDDEDDFGESVKLSLGTTLPDRITRSGLEETTINIWQFTALDCSVALVCADVNFADRTALDWGWNELIYKASWDPASSISDEDFESGGLEYTIHRIRIIPGVYREMDNTWSRSFQHEAELQISIARGPERSAPSPDDYRDWTLYIDDVTLPLSQALQNWHEFRWYGTGIQNLFADWTPSTTNRIGIMRTPFADQPQAIVPGVPRLVDADRFGDSAISVHWWLPRTDGGSPITGYKVQWKEAGDSWTDAAAVSEKAEDSINPLAGRTTVTGLTGGTLYTLRVIATNLVGDSQPSAEMVARPQESTPRVTESVVNRSSLTLRYDKYMNTTSVPATSSFVVMVNDGIRLVDSATIAGREVRLTLSSTVSAADEVTWLYQEPADPTAPALRDTDGNYAADRGRAAFQEATNETPRSSLQPLTAQFTNVPASHDGGSSFSFNIEFSESVWIGHGFPRNDLLKVTGGTVTSAHWLDRNTKKWAVTIRPETQGDLNVVLPGNRYCVSLHSDGIREDDLVLGAPCAVEDRQLTNQPEATIPGPSSQNQAVNSPATGGPGIDGFLRAGETLTATTTGIEDEDGISGTVFAYQWIRRDLATMTDTDIAGATGSTYTVTTGDEGKALMVRVTFTDDEGNEESLTSFAVIISPTLVTREEEAGNTPATGSPGIDGSPVVGQTLTAATSDIGDDEGIIKAAFAYQWLADDAAIDGSTKSTYTVASGDVGKTLKVRVTFTDDGGNAESVTSAATAAVKQPLTASVDDAPESHDGQSAFTFELEFSEEPKTGFSYVTLRDHAFTVTGATVTNTRRLEPGKNHLWEITVQPDGNADVTVSLPATTDCDSQGAVCTSDGRMLSTAVELVTPGPSSQQPQQVNSAATGAPTITGTAQVGEMLTANTSGITDSDGLSNATFGYQWLADGAAISNATSSSYTLANGDAGKAIRVTVTFTDDAGHAESLTSTATGTVAAANTPATGAPSITGTARVGETLTAATTDIADSDGLTNPSYTYQWVSNGGTSDSDIADATASAYTLAAADAGKVINVRVSFTDDAGNAETLTSTATAPISAEPQDPPAAPTNLTATANSNGSITLSWDAPSDDSVTGYRILRRRPREGENSLLVYVTDTGSTGTTYTDANAPAGTLYVYRVKAINGAGVGDQSNYVNVDH